MATKTYKLVYPTSANDPAQRVGTVIMDLTDEQAERMRRYADNPRARLKSVTEVKESKK